MTSLGTEEKKDLQLATTGLDGKTLYAQSKDNEYSGNVPEQKKSPPWNDLITDLTQETTFHGVRYITKRNSEYLRRFIWLLMVLCGWGILIFYATDRIIYYFQFHKNVNVEVNYLDKIPFPAVTVCNQNTFKITALADNGWYEVVKKLFPKSNRKKSSRPCVSGEQRCRDGVTCISTTLVCDLFPDCPDGSDEEYCDPCPLVQIYGPPELEQEHPEFVNQMFVMQQNTLTSPRALYVRENNSTEMYLYYENNKWCIGSMFGDAKPLAYAVNSVGSPDRITNGWSLLENGDYVATSDLLISCKKQNMELLEEKQSSSPAGLNLSHLYQTAAHKKNDFIQGCKWKGEACQEVAIKEKLTDMGICYTFNDPDDMNIEQAGPGNGLSLTLNIEYYEYTKDPSDGVGVKIVMHEGKDVAMVAEQGIAVSPGLYSFISVETTKVGNLPPPWGTCGGTELSYFSDYSISKCKVDCETAAVNKSCGCRDFFHPNKDAHPPVCDVDRYVYCAAVKIEEYRRTGNFCKCPTPCDQEAYVPTTSFAIVLSSNSADEAKMALLEQSLVKARETSYRIIKSNYKATMREFHVVRRQLKFLERFCQTSISALDAEYDVVFDVSSRLTTDCVWYRNLLVNVTASISRYLGEPFETYRTAWHLQLINMFDILLNTVEDAKFEYQQYLSSVGMTTQEMVEQEKQRVALIERQNQTLWLMYQNLLAAVTILESDVLLPLEANVEALPYEKNIRFNKGRFEPMRPYVTNSCVECYDDSNTPLTELLRDMAQVTLDSVRRVATSFKGDLKVVYNRYLKDLKLVTSQGQTEYKEYKSNTADMYARLTGVSQTFKDNIHILESANTLLHDLLEHTWRSYCQLKLTVYLDEYHSVHREMTALLDEVALYAEEKLTEWNTYASMYNSQAKNLQSVAADFSFTAIQTLIDRKETRLETIINKRKQVLLKIQQHIRHTLYLLMMALDDNAMDANSALWKKFNAAIPTTTIPDSWKYGEILLSQPQFSVMLSSEEEHFWTQVQSDLQGLADNLHKQTSDLRNIIISSSSYFQNYIEGNSISPAFYEQNFLQVELFYKELTERKVSQQRAYSYTNLLSEIGGLMGLLMGASVLSFMEFIDLFFYNSIRKCIDLHRSRVHPQGTNSQSAWK